MFLKTIVILALGVSTLAAPRVRFARDVSTLIVGGEVADQAEFPYIATLKYFGNYLCVATLIRSNILITSGQCAEVGNPQSFTVTAGEHDLSANEGSEQTRDIQSIVIHPDYSGSEFKNDIAILKTVAPFTINGAVAPIPLAHKDHTAEGNATIVGWGSTEEDGAIENLPRKATVPIVSDQTCRDAYGAGQVEENMICAGYPEGGVDVCAGDSGGPLVARDLGFRYLAGIVSFGFGCARPGFPSVYTEVSLHIDFIWANAG